jgi:hypothetical protein
LKSIHRERIAGAAVLVGGIAALMWFVPATVKDPSTANANEPVAELTRYASRSSVRWQASDPSKRLQSRDPVFLQRLDGTVSQVGFVERVARESDAHQVLIQWYAPDVTVDQCQFTSHHNPGRLEDAMKLMFPPEKKQRIGRLIAEAMTAHGERITKEMMPIMERSLRESLPAIESGFRASVARHRGEVDALGARWNEQVVKQRLVPLAKSEIVPIVRRRAEPLAGTIGRELWERASIWSFTWRALYDRTPLPQRDLMKREWERFVEEEAIPVLESHSAEIATIVQQTMVEIAGNAKVRSELAAAAEIIATDPQARALVQKVLRESIVENQELRRVWTQAWTSDEARRAIAEASAALEPTIRKLGDELMGTQEAGIDPAFARLLRNQVLQKDQRWLMATEQPAGAARATSSIIEPSRAPEAFPVPTFAGAD